MNHSGRMWIPIIAIAVAIVFVLSGIGLVVAVNQTKVVLEVMATDVVQEDATIEPPKPTEKPGESQYTRNRYYNRLHYLLHEYIDWDSEDAQKELKKQLKQFDLNETECPGFISTIFGNVQLGTFLMVYDLLAEICVRDEINPGIIPYDGTPDFDSSHSECKEGLITPEILMCKLNNENGALLFGSGELNNVTISRTWKASSTEVVLGWEPYEITNAAMATADNKISGKFNGAMLRRMAGVLVKPSDWLTDAGSSQDTFTFEQALLGEGVKLTTVFIGCLNIKAGGCAGQSYLYSFNWDNSSSGHACIYIPWAENPSLADDKRAIAGLRRQLYSGEGIYLTGDIWDNSKEQIKASVEDIKQSIKSVSNIMSFESLDGTGGYFDENYIFTYGSRPSSCYLPDAVYTLAFELRSQLVAGFTGNLESFPKMQFQKVEAAPSGSTTRTVEANVHSLPTNMSARGYSETNIVNKIFGGDEQSFAEYNAAVISLVLSNQHMPNAFYDDLQDSHEGATVKFLRGIQSGFDEGLLCLPLVAELPAKDLTYIQQDHAMIAVAAFGYPGVATPVIFNASARVSRANEKRSAALLASYKAANGSNSEPATIGTPAYYKYSTDSYLTGIVAVNQAAFLTGRIKLIIEAASNNENIRQKDAHDREDYVDVSTDVDPSRTYDYLWPLNSADNPYDLTFVRFTTLFYTDYFGNLGTHGGLDIVGDVNGTSIAKKPVYLAMPGKVKQLYTSCLSPHRCDNSTMTFYNDTNCGCKGWGNCVVIDHGNGYLTRYAHLEPNTIPDEIVDASKNNTWLDAGTLIGRVGTTGNSTGYHLHFEMQSKLDRDADIYYLVNPLAYKASIFCDMDACRERWSYAGSKATLEVHGREWVCMDTQYIGRKIYKDMKKPEGRIQWKKKEEDE